MNTRSARKTEEFSKRFLYYKSFSNAIKESAVDESAMDRSVLYGVKLANIAGTDKEQIDLFERYYFSELILRLIASITPSRLIRIFPINKEYDGERWETKDYFYTKKMIDEHGWDNPINEAFEFIWDYDNWELRMFWVNHSRLISDMRVAQGQPGIMETWAAENNIPLYSMLTVPNGEQYLIDRDGKTKPVVKRRAKHLKLIKG